MPGAIHDKARELGFDLCGIARVRRLSEREAVLREWVSGPRHGSLGYMECNVEKRLDPSLLVENAASVVVCAASYNREDGTRHDIPSRIASYALSKDYHTTIGERMRQMLDFIIERYPGHSGRVSVDSAPVLEKAWAAEAGLGWIGRNSLLVNQEWGSFLMLGLIITDAVLPADAHYSSDGCGDCSGSSGNDCTGYSGDNRGGDDSRADCSGDSGGGRGGCEDCRACIEACPAGAIGSDRMIDASRCISALTIEKRASRPPDEALHGRIFGCDICQKVCPYNRKARVREGGMLALKEEFFIPRNRWLAMDDAEFSRLFGDTPLERVPLAELQHRIEVFTKE